MFRISSAHFQEDVHVVVQMQHMVLSPSMRVGGLSVHSLYTNCVPTGHILLKMST